MQVLINGLRGTLLLLGLGMSVPSWALSLPWGTADFCADPVTWQNAWACGKFSGSFNTLSYSTHEAYFVPDLNQDTTSTGGWLKYSTHAVDGIELGISYALQRRLDDKDSQHAEVTELAPERDGLAEAYLKWQQPNWQVVLGQHSLDLPFVGDYNWRVMPPLYRGLDVRYQPSDDQFIRITAVDRFKSYAQDQFNRGSRYSAEIATDGMWSVGIGQAWMLDEIKLSSQLWYQSYLDYSHLAYSESHLSWPEQPNRPDLGLQLMWATEQGHAHAGQIEHFGIGAQIKQRLDNQLTLKLAYNYIRPQSKAYLNGALFAPYMVYTASGPYFAQPFFTSTQDLGSGHAWMFSAEGPISPQWTMGSQLSWMNLKEAAAVSALNQSEWVIYNFYQFSGVGKGWSLAHFMGAAHSPRHDELFLQNRLAVKYQF